MDKKYFPIQAVGKACQLKWAWSTVVLPDGNTASCHRVDKDPFDIHTFEFHNIPEKIAQRQLMLDGQWPEQGCAQYCGRQEASGAGQSDRQFFANVPDLSPPELFDNPTATTVTPTILEIYVDNVCNLSCVYCGPRFSSRIDAERKKFGYFNKNGLILDDSFQKIPEFDQAVDQMWVWLKDNVHKLKRLHLLGGEPFYQKQFDTFLEFFDNNPCPELEFNIVTNLVISKAKLEDYIGRMKLLMAKRKLKRLDITVSIDCWGPEQEFVRWGIDLEKFRENFEYLISQRWITLNINSTISNLTIKTMPELIKLLNGWAQGRKIEHYFDMVTAPSHLAPYIFGPEEFDKDFAEILSLMETETWRGAHASANMQSIAATVKNSKVDPAEVLKLITCLDEMDHRRNTNWRSLFPWLIKYEELCGIVK